MDNHGNLLQFVRFGFNSINVYLHNTTHTKANTTSYITLQYNTEVRRIRALVKKNYD
jgi:hypothetical protein